MPLPWLSERGITCALFILLACKVRTTNNKNLHGISVSESHAERKDISLSQSPVLAPYPPPPKKKISSLEEIEQGFFLYLEVYRKLSGTLMPGLHCLVNCISGNQLQCYLKRSIHKTGQDGALQANFTCNNLYQWMFPQSLELCQS